MKMCGRLLMRLTFICQRKRSCLDVVKPKRGLTREEVGHAEKACLSAQPIYSSPALLGERRRFALSLSGCPAVSAAPGHLRHPAIEPRQQRVPATATPCGGIGVFTSGGAPAPRNGARARPGGSYAARRTRYCARHPGRFPSRPPRGRPRASAGRGHRGRHSGPPAPCARESPSLSPVGGHCLWVVFPTPVVHSRLVAPYVPPNSLSCL